MPAIPNAILPPEAMPWARWVQDNLTSILDSVNRQRALDANVNATQNAQMTMVVKKLGDVTTSVADMVSTASFDAGQVVSGTFNVARIPNISAAKITSGNLSIPGSISGTTISGSGSGTISGDLTVSGDIYVPNSFLASAGYVVAYINGDGRLSKGASSRRFKHFIMDAEVADKNFFQHDLREFAMDGGDDKMLIGYIAEELVGTDSERFVVYESSPVRDAEGNVIGQQLMLDDDGQAVPLSIDFISMLIAQVRQVYESLVDHADRLDSIERRLEQLEGN